MSSQSSTARIAALAAAVTGVLFASQALASGFQIRENSTKNAGRAFSGSAVARDDASVVLNNPAAMVNLKGNTVQADLSVIDLNAKFEGRATTPFGTAVSGGNGGDPGAPTAVPALAAVFPLHGALEGVTVGASVSAPFGLKTEYDVGWMGRYNATVSDLKTVDLTLSAAVQMTPTLSAGIGLIYQRAEVELGKALPYGVITASLPATLRVAEDGVFTITGKDNSLGFVAGLQWRPSDRFALGYSHRSEIKHDFAGQASFTGAGTDKLRAMGPGLNALLPLLPAAQRPQVAALANGFRDTGGQARLVTPAVDTLSAEIGVSDQLRLYAEAQRTAWSSLRAVTVAFSNPFQPISSEAFNWEDTMMYALGADYALSDSLTVRGGFAYDQTPTRVHDRTPRLPDNSRRIASLGMTWKASPNLSVDAAYSRVSVRDTEISLPPDLAQGRYTGLFGKFTGHANVFAVGASYRF